VIFVGGRVYAPDQPGVTAVVTDEKDRSASSATTRRHDDQRVIKSRLISKEG
jgi:hypothetical protein